ncbi:Fe-S cluster assembly protein SufD [Ktedonosporobacter rubrisoli]|uniref:Fe-S cluster assembly protein SufD n=1 Tax=Ktedonosporobacter rubrisoli TaxID=2509675 RepID=A0A4P6JYQ4_KTERU|nr:Fe-S cluster assembly protein SufD [Ktedonosporobacter rubrisoli]QBD80685.1 Fe-S cluster assembly protein SufD [Ktedonosporobacter rubrisoli]
MLNAPTAGFSRSVIEELSRRKGEPEWMLQLRLRAWEAYESTPAPLGRRGDLGTLKTLANFKFQDLNPLALGEKGSKLPARIEESLQEALVNERSGLIIQHNGSVVHTQLSEELKEQGVILSDLDTAVREHPELVQKYFMTECVPALAGKYTALHAAFWTDGFFLYVPKGVEIEAPILAQVWIDAGASAIFAHTLIIAEEQSSVRFVEEYTSNVAEDQASLLSDVVEVFAKREARVEFSNLQDLDQHTWNITDKNAVYAQDGSVTFVLADLGSKLTFANIGAGLQGDGSAAELVGVFFTDHDQRYTIKTLSDHAALSTNAETMVKGVLTDQSRVEFEGMIRVEPGAQQTASFLSAHALLLSKKARAELIPGLEIAANEVSASHGATSGQIDEQQLFYLMVRGIPRPEAERIVVQGFFEPVLQRIPLENLRIRLRRSIVRRMSGTYETEADTWVDAQERWEIEGVDEGAIHLDGSTRSDDEIKLQEY